MSAWKQFLASDIIVNPFVVNKGFTFTSGDSGSVSQAYGFGKYGLTLYGQNNTNSTGSFLNDDVGISRFVGSKGNYFTTSSITGPSGSINGIDYTPYNQTLIYDSIKQLYYSNFISSSQGDLVSRPILIPGSDPSGDQFVGRVESPLYDNFLQSTLTPQRFIPTGSGNVIGVISIPSKIFGDYIQPYSVRLTSGSSVLIDDGEGNLLVSGSTFNFGNVIYSHGIITFTNSMSYALGLEGAQVTQSYTIYGVDPYGTLIYGDQVTIPSILSFTTGSGVTLSFSSSMTIYETQYKCTIRESEFNATLNPSARDANGNLKNNVTGSYFSPYVTTVGLYDEMQNLLAVGKLSQPLPTSATTDTTILVNIDK